MKYRVRKEEAERKLENTRKNLVRLNDILEELSRQIGPLEEQSAAARQYLKLRDELKEIEVNVFLYQYDKLNERITTLNDSMAQYAEAIRQSTGIEAALAADAAAPRRKGAQSQCCHRRDTVKLLDCNDWRGEPHRRGKGGPVSEWLTLPGKGSALRMPPERTESGWRN